MVRGCSKGELTLRGPGVGPLSQDEMQKVGLRHPCFLDCRGHTQPLGEA